MTSDEAPAQREKAPGNLELVQDFINSTELPGGWDELADTGMAGAWLRAHGFDITPDEPQRRRMVETRRHLRALVGVNSGQELLGPSAAKLTRLLDRSAIQPVIGPGGVRLAAKAGGFDGFLASLLAALVESSIDGTFRRLKLCRADTCLWAFYDSSKNACGAWCSMRSCGSRAKAKAYRERHKHSAAAAETEAVTR